jgi:hypothetical protein
MAQKKSNFRQTLRDLFSSSVIVRAVGVEGKLRIVDTSRIQSAGSMNNSRYIDRYNRLYSGKSTNGNINNSLSYETMRPRLYADYEAMDTEPILASALDIYADETTMPGPGDQIVQVVSEDHELKLIIENLLYDILNIDFNLWPWVRSLCKY